MVKFKWETEFKETDIGKVCADWDTKKLGDVITLQRGVDLPTAKRVEGKYPVVGSTGVVGFHNKYVAEGPGVLVGRSGSTGSLTYIKEPYWPLNTTLWVKDFKGNDPKFIYYFLHKLDFSLYSGGVSVPTLNRNILHPLEIAIPQVYEQKRIAAVLSCFDDLIENKKKQNEVLEKVAMAVFKSWFVDFEPFRDGEFVPSELGEIPKSWYVGTLRDISRDIVGGLTPLKREAKYWDNGTIPWLTNKEVDYGRINFIFDTNEKVSSLAIKETNLKLLPKDCLIISFTASVGKVAINKVPLTTNQQFISFIPKADFYLYYAALYFAMSKELIESYSGATPFDFISMERALQIPLLIPPPSALEEFHRLVNPLFQKIAINEKAISILRSIRDTLLPLLVFGKLRVEEI